LIRAKPSALDTPRNIAEPRNSADLNSPLFTLPGINREKPSGVEIGEVIVIFLN
jgi:hypothetical protein